MYITPEADKDDQLVPKKLIVWCVCYCFNIVFKKFFFSPRLEVLPAFCGTVSSQERKEKVSVNRLRLQDQVLIIARHAHTSCKNIPREQWCSDACICMCTKTGSPSRDPCFHSGRFYNPHSSHIHVWSVKCRGLESH